MGIDVEAVRYARQVHGTACLSADHAPPGLVGAGDALVTTLPGRPLAIFTADCLPVLLVDPEAPVLALVHAGWRGTVAGILGQVVAAMVILGARPDRLTALIGPSIGPCCYEVDEAVMAPLREAFGAWGAAWLESAAPGRPPDRRRLDLWRAAADQLVRAGVQADAVANPGLCTRCRGDLFFSYRREGPGRSLVTIAVLE
jgi:hypothetical protein